MKNERRKYMVCSNSVLWNLYSRLMPPLPIIIIPLFLPLVGAADGVVDGAADGDTDGDADGAADGDALGDSVFFDFIIIFPPLPPSASRPSFSSVFDIFLSFIIFPSFPFPLPLLGIADGDVDGAALGELDGVADGDVDGASVPFPFPPFPPIIPMPLRKPLLYMLFGSSAVGSFTYYGDACCVEM
jgi:hypothetical protein